MRGFRMFWQIMRIAIRTGAARGVVASCSYSFLHVWRGIFFPDRHGPDRVRVAAGVSGGVGTERQSSSPGRAGHDPLPGNTDG
jgi:hypothetical protein